MSFIITTTMPDIYHNIEDKISEAIKSLDSQINPTLQKQIAIFVFFCQDLEIVEIVNNQKVGY